MGRWERAARGDEGRVRGLAARMLSEQTISDSHAIERVSGVVVLCERKKKITTAVCCFSMCSQLVSTMLMLAVWKDQWRQRMQAQ